MPRLPLSVNGLSVLRHRHCLPVHLPVSCVRLRRHGRTGPQCRQLLRAKEVGSSSPETEREARRCGDRTSCRRHHSGRRSAADSVKCALAHADVCVRVPARERRRDSAAATRTRMGPRSIQLKGLLRRRRADADAARRGPQSPQRRVSPGGTNHRSGSRAPATQPMSAPALPDELWTDHDLLERCSKLLSSIDVFAAIFVAAVAEAEAASSATATTTAAAAVASWG
uniref:Uncharacterized protein n=1 Tax=Oryza sativa subsp. japonica TaxID=39947 RepID=Q5VPX3_ORYSJ|nr:hypothetical protein [Oryza sativa Japonica Group]BAD68500.1 hypothetical protein [Oryza sativa Japonica Group]